jgi:hypothetical protein
MSSTAKRSMDTPIAPLARYGDLPNRKEGPLERVHMILMLLLCVLQRQRLGDEREMTVSATDCQCRQPPATRFSSACEVDLLVRVLKANHELQQCGFCLQRT